MPKWTDEQLDAITHDNSNIIVSAGAGSGKTAVLSERVLEKLKKGVNIDELLILTFTNAAAHEMKERIRSKISEHDELKEQLDKIDSAYITTFDSFALSIVKKYNYLLNVGKNISIIDSSVIAIKKDEFIDEIFEKLYKTNDPDFTKLISDLYLKDDTEFKKSILRINDKLDLLYNKKEYLDSYLNNFFSDDFINNSIKEYENLLFKKVGKISLIYNELEEYLDSDLYSKLESVIEPIINSKDYDELKENINAKLPTFRGLDEDAKKIKENLSETIKEVKKMMSYESCDKIKEVIKESSTYIKAIIKIINELDNLVSNYKLDINYYEFNDIAKMAIKVLDENEIVRENLKNSLKEIMIDEYQDTSDLQDLFISYIENNNVYMVGDIKQSIYRFRNANPMLFKDKYDSYSKKIDGYKIDLTKNFRSREEVLNNINLIFELIMNDNIGGAEYKVSHKMNFGNPMYLNKLDKPQDNNLNILKYNYDTKEYKKQEIEAFIVLRDIESKIKNKYQIWDKDHYRDCIYSDFAILIDKSTSFDLYKKIFEYNDIPLQVVADITLNDSVDLYIIKNIIKLILSNSFDTSFKYSYVSVLRSYLFNMNDNEIFESIVDNNYSGELLDIVKSIDRTKTIKEILDEVITKFNFYERMITVGDVKKHILVIDYLTDLASTMTDIGYTLEEFSNYLDLIVEESDKYKIKVPMKDDKDGVKIMTIHKSKGLEFPICYFTELTNRFNMQDINNRFLYDNKYGIVTPMFDNGIRTTIYKDLVKESYIKENISERIRLFYVALTRAKEKMIMVLPNKEIEDIILNDDIKMNYKSLADMMYSIQNVIDKYSSEINFEDLNLSKNYNYLKESNYKDNLNDSNELLNVSEIKLDTDILDEKHFSKENYKVLTPDEYNNIEFGKKIHSIFEHINLLNPDYSDLSSFEKNKVDAFINKGILKDVLNIYKEFEFMYKEDNIEYHGIIDLLLEYKDSYKIIDYKLKNIDDPLYIEQLNGYKKYIESITGKKTEIYLYSIIDEVLKKI